MIQLAFFCASFLNTSFCGVIGDDPQPIKLFTSEFIQPFLLFSFSKCIIYITSFYLLIQSFFLTMNTLFSFSKCSFGLTSFSVMWLDYCVKYTSKPRMCSCVLVQVCLHMDATEKKKNSTNALMLIFYLSLQQTFKGHLPRSK